MKEVSYSYEEAYKESLKYFNNNELSTSVFLSKYALRDKNQNILEKTPEQMHRRIAKEFARIEKKKFKKPYSEDFIFGFLDRFKYIIPQGSPLYGIGNKFQITSLSNCFVIPSPEDSYSGILKTDQEIVQVSKRRGGIGTDVTNLRPAGTETNNASRTSTGIIPFCSRFSNSLREVGQDGRRGAGMISCDIRHPESVIVWNPEVDGELFITQIRDKDIGNFDISSNHYNPNKLDFCTMKYDRSKVTGANISLRMYDVFFEALQLDGDFKQQWPVDSSDPKHIRTSKAKDIWEKIIHSAWQTAEPGILFWDTITRESPADCYSKFGYKTLTTNPCVSGETLVYVADGRGNISIKQLAEEGKDVPVFCYDNNGKVAIRTMRNPRVTGYNKQIFKVTLEDGVVLLVTGNHKFLLTNGNYVEAENLKNGDSVKILTKFEASLKDIFPRSNSNSQDYYWLNNGFSRSYSEHRIIAECAFGAIQKGNIVHHKDYNAKNNSVKNLEIMSKQDHDTLHSKNMIGDKNPMRRAKLEWSKEKWAKYSENMSNAVSGELNGKFSGYSNEEIKNHAIKLTKEKNARFSKKDWMEYAKENNLPQSFSEYRKSEFNTVTEMAIWAARECNIKNVETDPRLVKTLKAASVQYEARILDGEVVVVERKCEWCGETYEVAYSNREVAFCGRSCSNHYLNSKGTNEKRSGRINETYKKKAEENKQKQMFIYTGLKFKNKCEPKLTEWEKECKVNNIPSRLNTKHGFKNFDEVKECSLSFNHRVVSVEKDGFEDVYNGTVDDFHNFFIGGVEGETKNNKKKWTYVNNLQCGEIPLSAYDSCRLLVLNLFSFVKNPFKKDAYFDYKYFFEVAEVAQRLMDDLIDLEEEAVTKIIDKIKRDPEDEIIKATELNLWNKVLETCKNGRRTGTGITALGDAIGALNIGYGTEEGILETERIYRTLKFAAYSSSVKMAEELGAFPVWNHELEKDNPFLNRIKNETVKLSDTEFISGEELYNKMKIVGRRNISLLTTAPVGSVSIECLLIDEFGTSSGIEPEYEIEPVERKKKINPNDENTRVDYIDQNGDRWQKFTVYCSALKEWMKVTGETDYKKSPWHNHTASALNWDIRVRLQAAAQRHVCHSISSTINLPNDVTVEDVKKIYETAWKSGCFREGNDVYTEFGLKDISQITVGDRVFGSDGNLHSVIKVHDLPEENRRFVKLKIIGHEHMESTAEHPYYVLELDKKDYKKQWNEIKKIPVWKKACDIKVNDHILLPKILPYKCVNEDLTLNISDYLSCDYILEGERIYPARILPWNKNKKVKAANGKSIPSTVKIDEKFCKFIGWFIAEGHYDSESYVRLTFNYSKEQEIAHELAEYVQETFGLHGSFEKIESNNGISLRLQFGSKLLCQVLEKLVGRYSENKHLPEWFTVINHKLLKTIIDNHYFGDKGVTISRRLARELFLARHLLGQKSHFEESYGEGYEIKENTSYTSTVAKCFENFSAYRVFDVGEFYSSEKVYNFSVEDTNDYIVNGSLVHNCKGVTVYRDGCRIGVLSKKDTSVKENKTEDKLYTKRPKSLDCDIKHVRVTKKVDKVRTFEYLVIIGLMDGKPYELFALENGILDKKFVNGKVIKNGKGEYDLVAEYEGEVKTIKNITKDTIEHEDLLTRMVSLNLRHGVPMLYVISQLEKCGDLGAFNKAIMRSLKSYIQDGTEGDLCKDCLKKGEKVKLIMSSGCFICPSCGGSKCS